MTAASSVVAAAAAGSTPTEPSETTPQNKSPARMPDDVHGEDRKCPVLMPIRSQKMHRARCTRMPHTAVNSNLNRPHVHMILTPLSPIKRAMMQDSAATTQRQPTKALKWMLTPTAPRMTGIKHNTFICASSLSNTASCSALTSLELRRHIKRAPAIAAAARKQAAYTNTVVLSPWVAARPKADEPSMITSAQLPQTWGLCSTSQRQLKTYFPGERFSGIRR